MSSFRLALSFLTIIPVRPPAPKPGDLGRAAIWFPTIGLFLGALLAAAYWSLCHLFSPMLAAALTVGWWALLTGGLHLDGLADCGDGLAASVPPERRLEIMRDPRLGTFGSLCLLLFLLIKIFALASLPLSPITLYALLLAPVLARWLMLWVARQPPARTDGLGASFAVGISLPILWGAALLPLALIPFGGWRALAAAGLALLTTVIVIGLALSRLGGVTGDVLGFSVELSELATLIAFAAGVMA